MSPADLQTIAEQLGCDTARVEATLLRLQAFDPPGVFARDLRECLALQLKDRDRHDPAMACLLENLDLLARGEQAKLMKLCNVDSEDLLDMVAEIRSLSPKPGESFTDNAASPVTPDVIVRRAADGGWLVELNPGSLPRVLVNNTYAATLKSNTRDREARRYISDRIDRGELAGAGAAAARDHHPEGGDGDRRASRASSSSAASAICGR